VRVSGGSNSQMMAQMTMPEMQANAGSIGRRAGDCARMTMARHKVIASAAHKGSSSSPARNLAIRSFMHGSYSRPAPEYPISARSVEQKRRI